MKHCEALCIGMQNISGNVYHLFFFTTNEHAHDSKRYNCKTCSSVIYSSKPVFLYSRVEIHTTTNIVKLCLLFISIFKVFKKNISLKNVSENITSKFYIIFQYWVLSAVVICAQVKTLFHSRFARVTASNSLLKLTPKKLHQYVEYVTYCKFGYFVKDIHRASGHST